MADIRIEREHALGLAQARQVASIWADQARSKYDMDCNYEEGDAEDVLSYSRSGVNGTLAVTPDSFELNAKLGFMLSAFKDQIEEKIVKNLDALIATAPTMQATPQHLANDIDSNPADAQVSIKKTFD